MEDSTENPRAFGDRPEIEPESNVDEEGNTQASEDEQMDNDFIVVRARKMMFGAGRENILKQLGSSPTPAEGIGKVASMMVRALVQSAKEGGRNVSEDAAINAGHEIGEDLNDLAKSNGVFEYDSEEDEMAELQDASLWGVKYYGDEMIANNEITPEMQQQAQKTMADGVANEGGGMKKNPVAEGVEKAVKPGGMINNAMQESV